MNFSITPSHILEYLFCPRFTYFEYVLNVPQNQDKFYKVKKGRDIHEKKSRENIDYLRRSIGVVDKKINQYLTSDVLRGEVDEVLTLEDGSMAPLDYKFAEYKDRIFDTYKTQLYCYALLIESNYQKEVNKGYLVYVRSKNKLVEIEIGQKQKDKVKSDIKSIATIIEGNVYPNATRYKKRCLTCTYRNICTK